MPNDEGLDVHSGEPVDIRYGCTLTILTACIFQCVHSFLSYLGRPKSVEITDRWKWRNLLISWIHALICGVWDLKPTTICPSWIRNKKCLQKDFYLYPDMFQDMISYTNYHMYGLVAFSTGYFIYDFLDMIVNNKALQMWEVTLHHIAVLSIFLSNLLGRSYIAYSCVALLMEVNSIFLHARKLLQMLRIDFNHWIYRLTVGANLLTFVVFRGLALGCITYGMYVWYDRVSLVYFLMLTVSMLIMNVINPVLFWCLLKNDFLRKPSRTKANDLGRDSETKYDKTCSVNNNITAKAT